MTTINLTAKFTPEDLLRLEGGDHRYELVNGLLVEKNMSSQSGATTAKITGQLYLFLLNQKLGEIYNETTFKCFPDKPDQIRRPDVAFIASARLSEVPDEGHIPIRPDLAIEVISPGDLIGDLEEKLRDYRSAAIPFTWVFHPAQRIVRIYEAGRFKAELEANEELRGEPLLPGFAVRVGELFPAIRLATP